MHDPAPSSDAPPLSSDVPLADPSPDHFPAFLDQSLSVLDHLGPAYAGHRSTIQALADRYADGRFQLAVLGQFKRGKSTLINALLGEGILPSSVIPLTAIPTFIRHGPVRSVRVHFQDGRPEEFFPSENADWMNKTLIAYVSESANPKNGKGVSYVEITHPSPLLLEVVLIDTPGIGSTHRHNTEMTLNFLPQCDAALFLVSADPPITEVEVDFLRKVREKVARLFFVLNKVDYLSPSECTEALWFLQKVLSENLSIPPEGQIYSISAKKALIARESGDPALLTESGLPLVTDHLIDFLAREKSRVLREAVARKVRDVLSETLLQVQLETRSMELPIDALQERMALFDRKISEATLERRTAQDILAGDRNRSVELLEQESDALRKRAREHLARIAEQAMPSGLETGSGAVSDAIAAEIPVYFEHALGEFSARFDREISGLLSRHEKRADELVKSIRLGASQLFDIPYHAPEEGRAFEMARQPYWVSRKDWSSLLSPLSPETMERALPRAMREKRIRARLEKEIGNLVIRNVENLRWATLQNIDDAFRVFSRQLDEDLARAVEATHGAIAAAYQRRKEHADEIAGRTHLLQQASRDLQSLVTGFGGTALSG